MLANVMSGDDDNNGPPSTTKGAGIKSQATSLNKPPSDQGHSLLRSAKKLDRGTSVLANIMSGDDDDDDDGW